MLCPVVFLGGAGEAERVADGCFKSVASGAIRSTHWGDSLQPGAVSARFVRAMPVSSFLEDWHGVCMSFAA
jgi:hypothetical protein